MRSFEKASRSSLSVSKETTSRFSTGLVSPKHSATLRAMPGTPSFEKDTPMVMTGSPGSIGEGKSPP